MSKKKKKSPGKKGNQDKLTPEQEILIFFKESPGKQFSRKQVFKRFSKSVEKETIHDILEWLVNTRKVHLSDGRYHLGEPKTGRAHGKSPILEGKVEMTRSGLAFVNSEQSEVDILVNPRYQLNAMDGDRVRVRIFPGSRRGRKEGEIIEILERARTRFVGTIRMEGRHAFLEPDKSNAVFEVFIPEKKLFGAKNGDKAVAEVQHWPAGRKYPEGEIVTILGKAGEHDVEMKSILIENGFFVNFPEEVLRQASAIPEQLSEKEIAQRRDFRKTVTFTIDPEDAKDFDDALSVETLPDGTWEIGVHIADVAHYVQPGSALDKEAYKRGTSVYLVDRVSPMLPERISNEICSLRPKEDKFCFSVVFRVNQKAEVLKTWFGRTVIHSDKRFSYQDAQHLLDKKRGKFYKELKILADLAEILRKKRFESGALNFFSREVKFRLDDNNHPVEVYEKQMLFTNHLIEEWMLLANKYVGAYGAKLRPEGRNFPFVFRVHDEPDPVKLEVFREFAAKLGYRLKFENPRQVGETINLLLEKIKGKVEAHVLAQLAIRTMAKAHYTTKNIGHYGLSFQFYTHFTSPIRRYPDLMAHRLLEQALKKDFETDHPSVWEERCKHSSAKERNALDAERDSNKYMQALYMKDHLGEEFTGIISGVIPRGVFIELDENFCEGFVPANMLGDGDMLFSENDLCFVDTATGKKYQLGQRHRVLVVSSDVDYRRIEFLIVEEGEEPVPKFSPLKKVWNRRRKDKPNR